MNVHDPSGPMVTAALDFANRGWPVFPAPPGTKKGCKSAAHSDGRNWGATTDPAEIRVDWKRWPRANVGIVTGSGSGLIVVDADTLDSHGADGVGTLQRLISDNGPLPKTIEAITPSGGRHIYFRYPDNAKVKNSQGKIAPGIDVRGDGGMVLAAPSKKPDGQTYRWKNSPRDFELADCPKWLLDKIFETQTPKPRENAVPGYPVGAFEFAGYDQLRELLTYIDPDAGGYDQWCSILMALHDHTSGSSDGLALAEQWSAQGPKYQPGEIAQKWQDFAVGSGVGLGTICHLARQNGADLSEISRRHRRKTAGNHNLDQDLPAVLDAYACSTNQDAIDVSQDALASDMGKKGWDLDAKYVAPWGKWLFWSGTHWQQDNRLEHMTRVRKYLREKDTELTAWAKQKSMAGTAHKALRSNSSVTAIETLARSNPASVAVPDDFNADLMLLGTPGGVVDLRTGVLRDALREDMITKQTSISPAPQGTIPELWMRFLDEIFAGDADIISFLQRVAGYALTGMTTEHKLLFLYGTGRNGKSVFLNTLLKLWGDYARRASAATFLNSQTERHPTDIAGLSGARLVASSELSKGKTWDESVVKDLTGGDRMTARFMRGDFFDFDPQLTLIIAGNTQPSFRGVDEAIRSRVVLVPFKVTIPAKKRDMGLPDKLMAEGPAILRWVIDGAREWQDRGLDIPASIAAASKDYFDEEDILGQFIVDKLIPEVGAFAASDDLHLWFRDWSERQGHNPWTKRTLMKELKSRGFSDAKNNGCRGIKGLRLA